MVWGSNSIDNKKIVDTLLSSNIGVIKEFNDGEKIIYENNKNTIAIVLEGTITVNMILYEDKTITISKFKSLDIINFTFINENTYISSSLSSKIIFIDCDLLFDNNNIKDIMINIYNLLINSNNEYTKRLYLLSNKSTEDKLLNFIRSNSDRCCCTLSISYTELANYLCVDRSSMMRTLSLMEKKGMIKRKGRRILLIEKRD